MNAPREWVNRVNGSLIGVADFIPASSDVKGVSRAELKTLSMIFHNRARTLGMR
jgi:hypothetical protein